MEELLNQIYQDPHLTSLIIYNRGDQGWPVRAHFVNGPRLDFPESFSDYINKIFIEANTVDDHSFTPKNTYAIHITADDQGKKEVSIIGRP